MYLPFWAFLSFSVLFVAPDIFLQVLGTVDRAEETAFEQEYHWYVSLGFEYPIHSPLFAAWVFET
jgi:hypothetical protein